MNNLLRKALAVALATMLLVGSTVTATEAAGKRKSGATVQSQSGWTQSAPISDGGWE